MTFYTNLFSPDTFETFSRSARCVRVLEASTALGTSHPSRRPVRLLHDQVVPLDRSARDPLGLFHRRGIPLLPRGRPLRRPFQGPATGLASQREGRSDSREARLGRPQFYARLRTELLR